MTPQPIPAEERQRLDEISSNLLRLHKMLLDQERTVYEQANGKIASPGEFFQLVISHKHFEWLRQLSSMVVQIDEALAPRSTADAAEAALLLKQAGALLTPIENGNDFQHRYWLAIQNSTDVLFLHVDIRKLIEKV
jgi:hypothetical protein